MKIKLLPLVFFISLTSLLIFNSTSKCFISSEVSFGCHEIVNKVNEINHPKGQEKKAIQLALSIEVV